VDRENRRNLLWLITALWLFGGTTLRTVDWLLAVWLGVLAVLVWGLVQLHRGRR
jgi:hypothetical protein